VRLLKSEKFLAIGYKIASSSDLQALMTAVSKDLHLLRPEDLNVRDKMNYDGCERLCKPHVRELLKRFVPGKKLLLRIETKIILKCLKANLNFFLNRFGRNAVLFKDYVVHRFQLSR